MSSPIKTYCIIGDPVQHSLSPLMQNAAFSALGIKSSYISFRVPSGDLKTSIESLKSIGIAGFNVTIPHKISILQYLDELDNTASKSNAVNTVKNDGGKLVGYNTDMYGFIHPLYKRNIDFKGKKVLIIGAGGAAYAIVTALSYEKGIAETIVVNRSSHNASKLVEHALKLGLKTHKEDFDNLSKLTLQSDLIINSTSIGLNNERSPIERDYINPNSIVYDIVYKPIVTDLLRKAKEVNAKVVYGYEMFIAQGAQAFEIWTGCNAPITAMKKALFGIFGEPT
ncbi:MAG TPA: shikimate dehydrogenase [Nitrososphaeraceae archaeon]|jgi:shikimate dehydrogenase|nr:shikimate dehydrogenase [Nitrososphaeraceae archaeon]